MIGRRRGLTGRRAVVMVPCLVAVVLLGCQPEPGGLSAAEVWQRIDLLHERPEVFDPETVGPQGKGDAATGLIYLGQQPRRSASGRPGAPASQIGALFQRPETVLFKTVRLGSGSTFRFRPMGGPQGPCHCLYRVWAASISSNGKPDRPPDGTGPAIEELASRFDLAASPRQVLEASPYRETDTAPAFAVADLGAFDRQSVLLLLEVVSTGTGRWRRRPMALWGSPALRFRAPLNRPTPNPSPQGPPSIVMIGADTLRARALGAWGREPSVSPALDRLAEQSEVWLNAHSTFNSTNPSFTSVHTGLYGKNHGVYDLTTLIPTDRPTLARQLSAAGYETFAVFAANHLSTFGLADDFDHSFTPGRTVAAEYVVDTALERIDSLRQTERPFFAFLHLFDPHLPHTPPEPFALGQLPARSFGSGPATEWKTWREPGRVEYESERFGGGANALYYDEIAYMDRQIDRLLGHLEGWGLLENTVVVFFADHGENLDEHGLRFMHEGLWETTTHVPMMVRWPDSWREKEPWRSRLGARHEHLVQTIDLYPTLLRIADAEVPTEIDARSLLLADGREQVFFEHANRRGEGIRNRSHLLIEMHDQPFFPSGTFLYDLGVDPEEVVNVLLEQPDTARVLSERLGEWLSERDEAKTQGRQLTEKERRQLEALGYVDG